MENTRTFYQKIEDSFEEVKQQENKEVPWIKKICDTIKLNITSQ